MIPTDALDRFGGWRGLHLAGSGFFRAAEVDGRWWLIDPQGNAFLSMGLNHIAASSLKGPTNRHIFRSRYRDDENWIRHGVATDLKQWGFNTIGWTQEIVARYQPRDPKKAVDLSDPRRCWGSKNGLFHDRVWERERYNWAEMPYCHLLGFNNNAYYWDGTPWCGEPVPRYPDVYSEFFEDYCDWVARHFCSQMADDPYLIGYFYADTPDWAGDVHTETWLGDIDPRSAAGVRRLGEIASRYYRVIHDAIRRYDPNHLLFGDRFLGNRGIPGAVLEAMQATVDVLAVQFGGDFAAEKRDLDRWHEATEKPVLLADAVMPPQYFATPSQENRGYAYERYVMDALRERYIVGVHFCGAYIENDARGWGVKSSLDEPYEGIVDAFRRIHPRVYELAATAGS